MIPFFRRKKPDAATAPATPAEVAAPAPAAPAADIDALPEAAPAEATAPAADANAPAPAAPGKPGWRERLRNSSFARAFGGLFSGNPRLDDDLLDEIETSLLTADVGVTATTQLVESLRKREPGHVVHGAVDLVHVLVGLRQCGAALGAAAHLVAAHRGQAELQDQADVGVVFDAHDAAQFGHGAGSFAVACERWRCTQCCRPCAS